MEQPVGRRPATPALLRRPYRAVRYTELIAGYTGAVGSALTRELADRDARALEPFTDVTHVCSTAVARPTPTS